MRIRVRVMAPVERLGYARRTSRFQVRTGAQPEIAQGGFSLKGGIWIWHRDGVVHRLNGGANSKAPVQPVNNAGQAIQSCTLPGVGKRRRPGPIPRPAEYNSAIRQICAYLCAFVVELNRYGSTTGCKHANP